ncbi:hypothetical protein K7X08_023308 [Anisodus acutangulus]|uniref:HTH myb-type domain-containing protein n=1 Tax=Anisodus acutangulus TaxID=402998 RepID=A0A9Q1LEM6_9SOLA|nr:hypothetical protein K7X08_023308 [Anisodus acutangulus]
MGEEVKITDGSDGFGGDDNNRVLEWEDGLPSFDDLTPLSTPLIPPELASAFRITPEPAKTMTDVNRASDNTFSSLRSTHLHMLSSSGKFNLDEGRKVERNHENEEADLKRDGSDSRKTRRIDPDMVTEEADSALRNENLGDDNSAKTLKRPRLVWTPQLHKRFVDVVAHLGIKNAVPKTIMQLMNVEGLTRENVASHLQKYRLYLKRMQGLSNEGPSSSDHLFASTPVPQSLQQSGGGNSNGNGHNSSNGHMPMPMIETGLEINLVLIIMLLLVTNNCRRENEVCNHLYSLRFIKQWITVI